MKRTYSILILVIILSVSLLALVACGEEEATPDEEYVKVTFHTEGGVIDNANGKYSVSGEKYSIMVIKGEAIGKLPVPTKEGYTFTAWRVEKNSKDSYQWGDTLLVHYDRDFYAYWEKSHDCLDEDEKDHFCDVCDLKMSLCRDVSEKDHLCDICNKVLSHCVDADDDHFCDVCEEKLSECVDANSDHVCEICNGQTSECVDEDGDHVCDICNEESSMCVDEDDHLCDICGDKISECLDESKDHHCDVCGKELSICQDEDKKDHLCDVCEEVLSVCEDNDNDHFCDVCEKELSICLDEDNDHYCDICGVEKSKCSDSDDHNCDLCGEKISECSDKNNDHDCDVCGEELSVCNDDNGNHYCDICNSKISECVDKDDHFCDICGVRISNCMDGNSDHFCDVCKSKLTGCLDGNSDHYCDTCNEELSKCSDEDNHLCDVCGTKLSECADNDNDHFCDVCGKELTKWIDDNNDHRCDICTSIISACVDEVFDDHCDICQKYMGLLTFTLKEDDTYEVSGYTGEPEAVVITTYNGKPVTSIRERAFYICSSLKRVVLGEHVNSIGSFAFYATNLNRVDYLGSVETWCRIDFADAYANPVKEANFLYFDGTPEAKYLDGAEPRTIEIPATITEIKDFAFLGYNYVKTLVMHDSVTSVGKMAFYDCFDLKYVTFSKGLESIEEQAFGWTGLTSVTIPDSVTTIGSYAFLGCKNLLDLTFGKSVETIGNELIRDNLKLTSINVAEGNEHFSSKEGNLYNLEGNVLIQYALGKQATSFVVPEGVTTIGERAFAYSEYLTDVTIGNNVTLIDSYAFAWCKVLANVTIGVNVNRIGAYAFACNSLSSIYFEDTTTWDKVKYKDDWENIVGGGYINVSDPANNAEMFKSSKESYYWFKM